MMSPPTNQQLLHLPVVIRSCQQVAGISGQDFVLSLRNMLLCLLEYEKQRDVIQSVTS
jgi:hypothetical protein